MRGFGIFNPGRGICRETEALFGRADRGHRVAGRGGSLGGGADSPGRNFGTDFLSLEETVRWAGGGPGPSAPAGAGRERVPKVPGRRTDLG